MFDLKELLIMLGLTVGGPTENQDIMVYRQKLNNEIVLEQKLKTEIKTLEYKKMWEEVNETEKTDFATKWLKDKKSEDKLEITKKNLTFTRKKIKVLRMIIEKDSIDRLPIKTEEL